QAQDIKSYGHILDSWANGYSRVNQIIADAICAEITRRNEKTVIMLQDVDFCLVSSMIRRQHPTAVIQQFLHSPWPDVRYWYLLPQKIIQSMYAGLAGNDILGFQTEHDARNFLDGACAMLDSCSVDFETGVICWHEHRIQVRTYPISISVVEERRIVQSQEAREEVEKLRGFLGKKIIMRVDRIDPIKNIIGGFQAYTQMLDEHEELRGEVYFLAFLVPTRETMPTYDQYKAEVFKVVEEINQKYGSDEWQPIHVFVGNHRVRALAALQFYDVLLVNSFFDGMNLIAKEGVVLNQRNGILVLSRTTGAFSELGKAAIPISPAYTAETAQALYKALTLPMEERCLLAQQAREEVENHDITQWIALQVRDINKLLEESAQGF